MWIADAGRSFEIDRLAQSEFGIASSTLMERAGTAVFQAMQEILPHNGRVTVTCGKGNNGGDGFVVARLAMRSYSVDCLVAAREDELSHDSKEQLRLAVQVGVQPVFCDDPRWMAKLESLGTSDIIIDGLLGTGAKGTVQGPILDTIRAINRSGVPVVAVDVPSGIHCDTGEELGESIWAVRTVTFGLPKPYLFQGIGLEHSGYWTVADIGFPAPLLSEPTEAKFLDCEWVGALLPERLRSSHKGDNGTVLIVAGSHRMRGAAALACKAALRAGAGLVTVAAIESVCETVMSVTPEATLLPLPEHHGCVSADAARLVIERMGQFESAVFGPGMTAEEPVAEFLRKVWQEWDRPCVLDADALNCLAMGVRPPSGECVLTPHPGEMGRLLQCSVAELQADRFRTVSDAVKKFGKTVLLKGPFSIVGEEFQPHLVNSTGNSGMASAGMGDVLSGVIGTLLAQDLPAYYAAGCGMYWHGAAGDLCAETSGPVGFTARDVARALPQARAKITSSCDGCCY